MLNTQQAKITLQTKEYFLNLKSSTQTNKIKTKAFLQQFKMQGSRLKIQQGYDTKQQKTKTYDRTTTATMLLQHNNNNKILANS